VRGQLRQLRCPVRQGLGLAFEAEPFSPAFLLGHPQAQTVLAYALRRPVPLQLRRERIATPDGDFLDLDWLEADKARPHLLVLHGLEGSSASGYVQKTLQEAKVLGWGAVAMNFRSCSGEPNRALRSYCSGETADPLFVARHVAARIAGPLLAVGFSLGGNALLKLLAETGQHAPFLAAAAVSAPFDLLACARALDAPWGRCVLYRRHFLVTLKRKALGKLATHTGHGLDAERVRRARWLQDFDDAFTAPSNGYTGALDYYARCSSGPLLGDVRIPTLLLNAEDDPMIPATSLPAPGAGEGPLTVLRTRRGGHVGFLGGSAFAPSFWAESQAVRFLLAQLPARTL
jgi:predicted alpha/beta-fold hydrolase